MHRKFIRKLLVLGVVAATLSSAVPAASAAGTWTITGGPNFTANALDKNFVLSNVSGEMSYDCSVFTNAGTVNDVVTSPIVDAGLITSSTLGNSAHKCTGPLGSTLTASQKSGITEILNAASYNGSTKVMTGTITNIDLLATLSTILGTCSIEIKGTAGITYNNPESLLQFTTAGDDLEITSTSGSCAGFIATGNVVTFATTGPGNGEQFGGSPANPVTIEQP